MSDQVIHAQKTTGKFIVLFISVFLRENSQKFCVKRDDL